MRFLVLVGLVATLLAAACSGDSDGDPAATPTMASTQEAAAAPTASPTSTPPPSNTPAPEPTNTPEPEPSATPEPTATTAPPTQPPAPQPTQPPPQPTQPPAPSGAAVAIRGFGYHPFELRISAGTTVVWTNYDSASHDVTASNGSWASPLLGEGDSFSHTFTQPGRYAYTCKVHPYMGAAVIVE